MRTSKTYSFINVIGNIWMPNIEAAMSYTLDKSDIENILDAPDGE